MTTKYEEYTGPIDQDDLFGGNTWKGQTFTTSGSHTVTSVKFTVKRMGSAGTLTLSIRATTSSKPSGADLTSGTLDVSGLTYNLRILIEVSVTEYTLAASTMYSFCVRVSGAANTIYYCSDYSSPSYAVGAYVASTDAGVTWTITSTKDTVFEVWGNPPIVVPTVTTQAATSLGLD